MGRLAAVALFLTAVLCGADVSGIWVGQIPARNGELQEIAFQFIQKGQTVTGKLYGDYGSTHISEGKITGDQISFVVVAQEQAGNQINSTRLRFTGCIQNGEIDLTRERERSTNAGNAGGVQFRGNPTQTFRISKLI